jgi:hypothetical protein
MKIPFLQHPERYAGLFVYDFGAWVSVGYTADEIGVLAASPEYGRGQAFQIHRVDEQGRMELVGVSERDIVGDDIMVFASRESGRAGEDFAALRRGADAEPAPCSARIELADVAELQPPHVVALIYPRHATDAVARWLGRIRFSGGDVALGGPEVLASYRQTAGPPVASCTLRCRVEWASRGAAEVLRAVHEPVQR